MDRQDQHLVNVFKGLVIDAVHKANSGHPGGPMSSMDLAYILTSEYLRFDPEDPKWQGRDRFILSAGHMSMLQYAMLVGIGWLNIDDLKSFRQLHARTPGHPENTLTPGVECTTGPLGQGCAMSVGFAIAQEHLAATLDRELFARRTWVICSDGDLQEGVALDAASLAGHQKLGNLIWIYDSNRIQLSGPTDKTTSKEVKTVFTGLGWRVLEVDGHDHHAIRSAYTEASKSDGRPTLIIAHTVIGKGCYSLENSSKTHGSPLPAEERKQTKKLLGIPDTAEFYLPDDAIAHFRRNFATLRQAAQAWRQRFVEKCEHDQVFRDAYTIRFKPRDFSKLTPVNWSEKAVATRNAFGDIIKAWATEIPNLIGGSADLEPSNMTGAFAKAVGDFDKEHRQGRNLNFGVREFAMSSICNGMALHGGLIPFDATFLSFADYSRPALRLGALQKCRVIHEFTHDSFYLGEDGPTHQPVEQIMALRLIPDFYVMRPADAVETEILLRKALDLHLPSAVCLTRQKLPLLDLPRDTVKNAARGAYVVKDSDQPSLIIFATGSEVALALEAAALLPGEAIKIVSMPCWRLFAEQSRDYQERILSPQVKRRVSIEAGVTLGWERYVGDLGLKIGLDRFGESAPAEILAEEYGFTAKKVAERIQAHKFA